MTTSVPHGAKVRATPWPMPPLPPNTSTAPCGKSFCVWFCTVGGSSVSPHIGRRRPPQPHPLRRPVATTGALIRPDEAERTAEADVADHEHAHRHTHLGP